MKKKRIITFIIQSGWVAACFVLFYFIFSPVFVRCRAQNLHRTFKTNDLRRSGTNSETEMAIRAESPISFFLWLTPSVTDANFKRGA